MDNRRHFCLVNRLLFTFSFNVNFVNLLLLKFSQFKFVSLVNYVFLFQIALIPFNFTVMSNCKFSVNKFFLSKMCFYMLLLLFFFIFIYLCSELCIEKIDSVLISLMILQSGSDDKAI